MCASGDSATLRCIDVGDGEGIRIEPEESEQAVGRAEPGPEGGYRGCTVLVCSTLSVLLCTCPTHLLYGCRRCGRAKLLRRHAAQRKSRTSALSPSLRPVLSFPFLQVVSAVAGWRNHNSKEFLLDRSSSLSSRTFELRSLIYSLPSGKV